MKGVSALIGVVLSIGFVVLVAAFFYTFGGDTVDEQIKDVSDSEIESFCLLHVDLEASDVCLSEEDVKMTVKNNGDATITNDAGIRWSGEGKICVRPILGPEDEDMLAFETRTLIVEGCGEFVIDKGEFIPSVEIEGESYSCGVKNSFDVVEC